MQGIFAAVVFLTLGLLLIRIYPDAFVNIFTKDPRLQEICLSGIKIYLSTMPLVGICILGPIYFQSIGRVKYSIFLTLLRQVILFIPIISIISKSIGMKGVWISQPIADISAALIISVFLTKEIMRKTTLNYKNGYNIK